MASFGNTKVDYNQVHTTSELLPAGMYQAIIIESGGKPDDERTGEDGLVSSKNGRGRYLPMTFEIIDGECKGRQIYKNFNLENQNEQAVRIAQSEIKELLQAIGWDFIAKPCGPEDTSEIHNIPITLQIVVKNNKQTDEPQNEIKHFKPRQSAGFYQQTATAAAAKPAAPATPAAPPWQRNNAAQTASAPAAPAAASAEAPAAK